jgi:hypothetical protein
LSPNPEDYSEVLIVSIDFENTGALSSTNPAHQDTQAGLSILDPKLLLSSSPQDAFRTYNIGSGLTTSYRDTVNEGFLFGETIWVQQTSDLLGCIEGLLDRTRKIVLVSHGMRGAELPVLKALGFDFNSVVGYLDTFNIAEKSIGRPSSSLLRCRLQDVLARFGLDFEGFHIGGNDANFTMRALLLFALDEYPFCENPDEDSKMKLEAIKEFCYSRPPTMLPSLPKAATGDKPVSLKTQGTPATQKPPKLGERDRNEQPPEVVAQKFDFRQPSHLLLQMCPRLAKESQSAADEEHRHQATDEEISESSAFAQPSPLPLQVFPELADKTPGPKKTRKVRSQPKSSKKKEKASTPHDHDIEDLGEPPELIPTKFDFSQPSPLLLQMCPQLARGRQEKQVVR